MLWNHEFMEPFRKSKRKLKHLNTIKAQNARKKQSLREVAHRLNRKGIDPTKLTHTVKTVDSMDDSATIELDEFTKNKRLIKLQDEAEKAVNYIDSFPKGKAD